MASVADPSVPVNLCVSSCLLTTSVYNADHSRDLWDLTFAKLPSKDQQTLRSGLGFPVTIEDVRASIAEARVKADKKWTIKGQRGDINLRVHFDKIVHWVQEFVAIGDTLVTYDPGHAAVPWAAMRFLLQILVNNSERVAGFINGLNELAFYIYFCTTVERRFLRDETYKDTIELKNRIMELYYTMLQFMLKARQYFETSSAIRLVTGLHKPTDEITKILSLAESQFQKILIVSTFISTQLQQITRDSIEHLSKDHTESMVSLKSQLEDLLRLQQGRFTNSEITLHSVRELVVGQRVRTLSSLVRAIRLIMRVRKAVAFIEGQEYKHYDRTAVLKWLSTIPYQDHQTAARKEVQEGTGGWFLQDDVYSAWKASDETSLLWLHGPPGCGKSKLMSLAIEEALSGGGGSSSPDARVFYFHCSNNPAEPERADFESIIRCFVKQGSSGGTPSKPRTIPRYVVRKFKAAEVNGFASRHLSVEDCCAMMSMYAIDRGRMAIFIDALDECERDAREKIMDALALIVERSGGALVKLFISSRDDVSLEMLPKHKHFEILVEENRNQQDINGYVKAQLSQLIKKDKLRILGSKGVPKGLQAKLVDRLSQGAQGMFRWVSIQLEYLCTLKTKHDIENRLGQLPPKLVDIYGQLFRRRTESYGHEHRRILDVALSSLLLTVRPDATVFAQMLFANEGDESSEEDESSGGSDADMSASGTVSRAQVIQRPEAVTELCFNLVVFDSTSNVFRFAHTSVQDYILKHENGYYASQDLNCSRVAEHCISLLLHIPDQIHSKDQTFLLSEWQQGQTDCQVQFEDASTTDITLFYIQPPPISNRTRLERTLIWAQYNWGFFVFNSREYREKLPLRDLELDLQHALVSQPWRSVNPRIFFSACQYGLGSFVDAWTKTHPHLVNVRLLPATDGKDLMLGTGLQYACAGGHSGIIERLIDKGAVIDYYSQGIPKTNALCIAIQHCTSAIIKLLLDRGASPSLAPDADVRFPLHAIISNGHEDALSLVQILLEYGADIDLVDDQGMTAIAVAVEEENLEVVHLLLQKKAKPTFSPSVDFGKTHILNFATWIRTTPERSLKMAQLMLEHGLDVNFRSSWDDTPLWWAADYGNLAVTRLLLDHGAFIDVQKWFEGTPLMAAIRNIQSVPEPQVQVSKPLGKPIESIAQVQEHEDVARLLVSSGANTNLRASSGLTALHYAAEKVSSNIVELLINHGADPTIVDHSGWTPLHSAADSGYENIAIFLLAHNADVDATTFHGSTPLHLAAENGHENTAKCLLAHNADVKAQQSDGSSALHFAAYRDHANMVLLLVDAGSDLSAIDYQGNTALHYAASEGHDKAVGAFLDLGANPNILNFHGNSALSDAACSGKPEVCELLLPTTTDINSQDGDGDTPLSNAVDHSQPPYIIELLLGAGAQIIPQQAGPHCPFLHHTERIEGYGNDALLKAWNKKRLDLLQTILNFAARRDPGGDYAIALVLWEKKEKEEFEAWMDVRRANAPENSPEVVAFREEIRRREDEIYKQNKQRIAMELGIDPPAEE